MKLPVLVFLCFFCVVNCYKVLIVFPGLSRSHFILGNALGRRLAEIGHEITMVSPFEDKSPPKNYKNVVLTGFLDESRNMGNYTIFDFEHVSPMLGAVFMNTITNMVVNKTFSHPNFQKIIESNQKFDLIIVEQFKSEGIWVLQCHYKAPLILLNTYGSSAWINPYTGNPAPPSYIPDTFLSYSTNMNIWQRAYNTLVVTFEQLTLYFMVHLKQKQIAAQYFPECSEEGSTTNISLVFLNAHESSNHPVPLVPNMINIGGFHIQPSKKLPEDLQNYLDDAKEGVVYFSLGSNINSSEIAFEIKDAMVNSLRKLKQKVLWKYNEDDLYGKPENIELRKWLPQQEILAHPNVKLFITHGGLLSIIETVHYGVPVLVLPVFGDQKMNAAKAEESGIGLSIPFSQITQERFSDALDKLLNDKKYFANAKTRSAIFHDRPVKPMDLAVYWTEYIARHKGAPHLRVAALDLTWYQYLLLDVIVLVTGIVVGSGFLLYILCKKLCCSRKNIKSKTD